jgi:hypothetical protein
VRIFQSRPTRGLCLFAVPLSRTPFRDAPPDGCIVVVAENNMSAEKTEAVNSTERTSSNSTDHQQAQQEHPHQQHSDEPKKPWWNSVRVAGSATQIVIAAVLAIAIGIAVSYNVDKVPAAASTLVGIPGRLWLRSLRAVGE